MQHRNWLAPFVLGLALTGVMAPAAAGGGGCGGGYYGGAYGLRSVNSFQGGSRLYRHRSGYLYGAHRPFGYPSYGGGYAYGGVLVVQPAPTADQSCGVHLDPRQDFDCRRDRVLRAATRVDVSFLEAEAGGPTSSIESPGWAFLRAGEPAKALGRFTSRLMRSPGDGTSQVGYALAAALLGDDASAAAAMDDVMRANPRAIRDFANAERIHGITRDLLARYEAGAGAAEARLMTAALRAIRGEADAARAAALREAERRVSGAEPQTLAGARPLITGTSHTP